MDSFFLRFDFQSHLLVETLTLVEKELVHSFMEDMTIKKGNALFYEEGIPTGIFHIVSGRVKKFKKGFSNQVQLFYIYTPGDFLGYHALLGEERYQDSCEALDDVELKFISKDNFLKLLQDLPSLKDAFIKNMSHEFGVLANTIAVLAQKDQNTRLAIYLLVFENRFKAMIPDYKGIDLTREDLANCIGTSRESLGRSLKQFKDDGMISIKKRCIFIIDKAAFYKLLHLEWVE